MRRYIPLTLFTVLLVGIPVQAATITGKYVEARTCDVWTGPCFANAEFNITGKNAVLAWKVDKGSLGNVTLDGLGIAAVIRSSDTLGLKQTGPSRVIFIVDKKANSQQRQALIRMAQRQGGKLLQNIVAVRTADVNLEMCPCKNNVCAELKAGGARIKTRCLHSDHDRACGNESAFLPPLVSGVNARAAAAVEHSFSGRGIGHTWQAFEQRCAYVGTFTVR